MKVGESVVQVARQLTESSIPDAHLEAEVLHRHILEVQRAEFFAGLDEPFTEDQRGALGQLVQHRREGMPLAYLLGRREFYGLDFVVNKDVLVPRQETELLVDKVLKLDSARSMRKHLEIADVGTGSGAVAVAVAFNLPRAVVYATDLRPEALAVADMNRRKHSVADRVHLCQGDLLEALPHPVDVIVSNPPYVKTGDISHLAPEVRQEPAWALDGGADGLEITRRLLRQAPQYLRPGSSFLLEISPEQLAPVCRLAQETFAGAQVCWAKDLLGLPRVVTVRLP